MSYHSYNIGGLGAIEDIGVAPYQVSGDPVMALIAQINRFNRSINLGGGCGSRNYLPHGKLPLATVLSDQAATMANVIMYDRFNCVDSSLIDFRKLKLIRDGSANPIPWANANLRDITVNIAQFADSLGLPTASVGITTVDPRVAPKFPTLTVVALGALALGAVLFARRKR